MDSNEEILNKIMILTVDCPDCQCVEDDQYTCTTCWCQGGYGTINVFDWLKENPKMFLKA